HGWTSNAGLRRVYPGRHAVCRRSHDGRCYARRAMTHRGSIVDLATPTVRDRDGLSHALERVEIVDGVLYHARPVAYRTFDYHERWVLPVQGWVLNRFRWLVEPELDWYIEPELISIEDDCWTIRDGLLELWVFEGS